MGEVRFYMGKTPVEILLKSKRGRRPGNYAVLDLIEGKVFTTVPRMLWKRERNAREN